MLAAFVVVLTVSVATIAWSGTDDYVLVMVTLVVSLLVLMAATLAAGWILSTIQPAANADSGPSSELKQLLDRADVELDNFRKLRKRSRRVWFGWRTGQKSGFMSGVQIRIL